MEQIEVKVINNSKNDLPKYETKYSAGVDLRVDLSLTDQKFFVKTEIGDLENGEIKSLIVHPGGRVLVDTGLQVVIPEGYEIQIRPRSGLALKNGLSLVNTPGTIDSDYRGSIGVILINHGTKDFILKDSERIAQAILSPVSQIKWKSIKSFSKEDLDSDRGGGLGHTGTK